MMKILRMMKTFKKAMKIARIKVPNFRLPEDKAKILVKTRSFAHF